MTVYVESNFVLEQALQQERSKPYRGAPSDFSELITILIQSADQERDGLQRAVAGLVQTAEIIPLDGGVITDAGNLQSTFAMSGQDAIVFAAVLRHLEQTTPTESCFLNRNTKDFDDPDVQERLDRLGCRFFGRFDDGCKFVLARLGK